MKLIDLAKDIIGNKCEHLSTKWMDATAMAMIHCELMQEAKGELDLPSGSFPFRFPFIEICTPEDWKVCPLNKST